MWSKWLRISCIMCAMLFLLGCSCNPINAVMDEIEKLEEDYNLAKSAKNKAQLTDDEWDEVEDEIYANAGFWSKVGNNIMHPIKWAQGKGASSYASTHTDKAAKVSQGKLDAKEEARKQKESEENSKAFREWFSKNGKTVVVVLILGAALVMVCLFMFLMSRAKKPQPRVGAPKETKDTEAKEATVNYDKLLIAKCEEKGLDCNAVLEQYDGDARAACEGLMFS